MNADNAIAKIHEFEKFGSILGLERMNMLLKLLGNPEKAEKTLGWSREVSFEGLVDIMLRHDLETIN